MYKVLLVEDEDIIRKGLMFMVIWQELNCVVVGEAIDGVDGIQKIKDNEPAIVIVVINMPVMNGLQMLEESIKEHGYEAIIVSGYGEFEFAKKAIRLGVTEYLLKPVDFTELYDAIHKITEKLEANTRMRGYIRQIDMEKKKLGILETDISETITFKNKYVSSMVKYIEEHYSSRLSLTDLSEEYNLSCTYLNTKFKSETGYTFNDFLNRYRMQKAVELLKSDQYKVYEIAEMVGFSEYKYFIKVFKKYIGCSPAKFMEAGDGKQKL